MNGLLLRSTRPGFGPFSIQAAVLAGAIAVTALSPQERVPVIVRIEQDSLLVRYDPTAQASHPVYTSDGYVRSLSVSPDGKYLSFIETTQGPNGRERSFVVMRPSGLLVRRMPLNDIQRYVWCCGEGNIAVVTGPDYEGGIGFLPQHARLIDVETGAERKLLSIRQPFQLHWAAFDSSLYIKSFYPQPDGPAVYRYDATTRELSATSRKGVFFSPDGQYYFDPSVEGSQFRLYRATGDSEITEGLELPPQQVRWGPEGGWMPGGGHFLVFLERKPPLPSKALQRGEERANLVRVDPSAPKVNPDRWNLLVDAETGKIVRRFQGDIGAGWSTNAPALPVVTRGQVVELIAGTRP